MSGRAGFTLVEMLVALALFALLAVLLSGGLRLAARGWQAAEAASGGREAVHAAQEAVRRQIAGARSRAVEGDHEGFVGSAGEMRLAGSLPMAGNDAPAAVRLWVADGRLQLSWLPLHPDGGVGSEERRVLLGDVSAVRFAYFGAVPPDEPAAWREDWPSGPDLPRLVRIELARTGAPWPPLLARPMTGTGP